MTTDQLKELLERYLDGHASDEDLLLIEKWFHLTEERQYNMDSVKRKEVADRLLPRLHAIAWPQVSREQWSGASSSGEKRAAEQMEMPPSNSRSRVFNLPRRLLRIAAVLILIVGVGATAYHLAHRSLLSAGADLVPSRTVIAGAYEIKSVLLPDSSRAILKYGSLISFPARYEGAERTVQMEGEVYFDIKKDPEHVFSVHSTQMDIRVLGTSFVVSDSPAAKNACIQVLSGRVGLSHQQEDLGELKAGRQLTYNVGTGRASWRYADSSAALAWIHKTFQFNETPLESVFAAMENKFGVRFQLRKHRPDDIKSFTGTFSEDDTLKDMLLAISLSTGIHYSTIGRNAIEILYP